MSNYDQPEEKVRGKKKTARGKKKIKARDIKLPARCGTREDVRRNQGGLVDRAALMGEKKKKKMGQGNQPLLGKDCKRSRLIRLKGYKKGRASVKKYGDSHQGVKKNTGR